MEKFTKGFMDRSATKLSEKINDYAEKASAEIVSINVVTTNMDAPIIEAVVLFSKKEFRSSNFENRIFNEGLNYLNNKGE